MKKFFDQPLRCLLHIFRAFFYTCVYFRLVKIPENIQLYTCGFQNFRKYTFVYSWVYNCMFLDFNDSKSIHMFTLWYGCVYTGFENSRKYTLIYPRKFLKPQEHTIVYFLEFLNNLYISGINKNIPQIFARKKSEKKYTFLI